MYPEKSKTNFWSWVKEAVFSREKALRPSSVIPEQLEREIIECFKKE